MNYEMSYEQAESENHESIPRLKTVHVQPDLQSITDRVTKADRVTGFSRDSFGDSYRDLPLPELPRGEEAKSRSVRADLEKVEQGTV